MTKSEFLKAYTAARKSLGSISIATAKKIREAYITASKDVAAVIRRAEKLGLSDLTIESQRQLSIQLQESAAQIELAINENILLGMDGAVKLTSNINEQYLIDIFKNLDQDKITAAGIENMFHGLNTIVVRSVVNRVFTNGYTFAESVWIAGQDYQEIIKNVVSAGLAQNRDVIEIARDIEKYAIEGKGGLAKRYGKLKAGTRAFLRRIPRNVDWRALRLARSELYMSLQDASKEQGRANPGCLNLYDWILTAGRQHWNCECERIMRDSPYEYERIPAYPHPNCRCLIRPLLRDRQSFETDLRLWFEGHNIEYLDNWNTEYYLPLAA